MRNSLLNLLAPMAVGAAMWGGCAGPPVEASRGITLSLTAAGGSEALIASKPRVAMLLDLPPIRSESGQQVKPARLAVHELNVGGESATALSLDFATQPPPPELNGHADISFGFGVPRRSGGGVLVLLEPGAQGPSEVAYSLEERVSGDDPVSKGGDVAPQLTASQAEELGIFSVLPIYVQFNTETSSDYKRIFEDAAACPADRPEHPYRECSKFELAAGYHVGTLDAAREDPALVVAWFECSTAISRDAEPGPFGFQDTQALADQAIEECGEYPGNLGRVAHVEAGQNIDFEVGGGQDLMRGLERE